MATPVTGAPRLTAIVPTAGRWQHVGAVVERLLPAIDALGIEVIAVCGGDGGPWPPARRGVTYLSVPEPDVFSARATAAMAATGDVIALLEDHALPDENWARAVIEAWDQHPSADALIHSIAISAQAGIWEVALFTLTFGPFLHISEVPRDRLPVPGIVSFRRSVLPATKPPPGWLEYELIGELVHSGRIALTTSTAPVHVQPIGWGAARLAFHSGRMFAGSAAADAATSRRVHLGRVNREGRVMFAQTWAARRRVTRGSLGPRFAACATTLIIAHATGQLVGIATRSVGRSAEGLE